MRVVAAGVAVVSLVAALMFVRPGLIDSLDHRACDIVTAWAGPGHSSGRVAIVDIDERSLAQAGRWPWPRDLLASFVRRMFDAGASVVVLDLMFPEEDRKTNDEAFAAALTGKPAVIGYSFVFDGNSGSRCALPPLPLIVAGTDDPGKAFFNASGTVCSVPSISRAAAGSGFLNAGPDADGKLRRIPLLIEYGGNHYPALALAAMMLDVHATSVRLTTGSGGAASIAMDQQTVPLEGPSCLRLRFRGRQRSFPYISASQFIGDYARGIDLKNKIVVLGASALGIQGTFSTPSDPLFPASELQATAIDNLVQQDFFTRPRAASFYEIGLALGAGIASTLFLARIRSLWAPVCVLGMGASAWLGSYLLLSTRGVLLSPLPATAVLGCNYSVLTLANYLLERKRAERSNRRYRQLVENINDAIVMNDCQGRIIFANARFRQWFGWETRDLREMGLEDYVAQEWLTIVRDANEDCLSSKPTPSPLSYECILPDGSRIWTEALVSAVREEGKLVGTQSAIRDVTARKQMEAEYLQAQKMEIVGRLAGGVAHDFNNLLQVINGYTALILARLANESGQDQDLRADVEEIRWAGLHAAELTQRMLVFSRRRIAQPKPLDLNLVIEETVKLLSRMVGEDIEVVRDLHPSAGKVLADATLVQQALMNLVVNARDSMPHGGKLTVATFDVEVDEIFANQHPGLTAGPHTELRVEDTGTGMTEYVQRRIFDPFFTTKEPGKGTGLGLATVQRIVQETGGAISVSSTVGEGSRFHLYFPRITTPTPQQGTSDESSANLQGSETVLLVEDDDAVRRFTRTVLDGHGYRVLEAADANAAIALAGRSSQAIHLLLTDVILPGMNGEELAKQLQTSRPDIKVLYLSGYAWDVIGPRIGQDIAFLPKPFSPDALATKIRKVLGDDARMNRRSATT